MTASYVTTLLAVFGDEVPFLVYVSYIPFELIIGVWFFVKGLRKSDLAASLPAPVLTRP